MDVPHDLSETYSNYRKELVEYLESSYGAVQIESEDEYKYPVSLFIKIQVENLDVSLIFNIPFHFPDAFPQLKLDEQTFQKLYPLPHLNKFKTLCLFDDVLASPNPNNPIGLIEAVMEKAKEVLRKGILKENSDDYIDEFETYWLQDSVGWFLSIVNPTEQIKKVYLVPYTLEEKKKCGIYADQINNAVKWIQNIGGTYNEDDIVETLYVPLKRPMEFPYPGSNKDIYRILKENDLPSLKDYFLYLEKSPRPSKVLFSIQANNTYTWGAWEHQKPFKQNTSLYNGRNKFQESLKGFRKSTKNGLLELVRDFPEQEISKHYVEDVRASRLKRRGGDGNLKYLDMKIAIIGCGAVGSHLTQGLFDIGSQHVLLIDPDTLSFENISRHLCGANQVGHKKTEAVKNKLGKHYPSSQIHVCSENVLSFLKQYPEGLNSYDLIISAISHTPTELRLNELQTKGLITAPILNVWVEPYLAAGHAIWLEPNCKIHLNSIFDNGKYKYQVLKNGGLYSKRELGCNTSYVPYGALELKKFIVDVVLFIQQQWGKTGNSIALTWLGNLREQRINERRLEPKWVGANDFSIRYNKIENSDGSVELDDL